MILRVANFLFLLLRGYRLSRQKMIDGDIDDHGELSDVRATSEVGGGSTFIEVTHLCFSEGK